MLLSDSISNLGDIVKNTKIFEVNKDYPDSAYKSYIRSIYQKEKIHDLSCGKIYELAPMTYATEYNSKEDLLKQKKIYESLNIKFQEKNVEESVNFQLPKLIGYFTFDNNKWYLMFVSMRVPRGKDSRATYKGVVVNPTILLEQIYKFTDKISKEEAKELLSSNLSDVKSNFSKDIVNIINS